MDINEIGEKLEGIFEDQTVLESYEFEYGTSGGTIAGPDTVYLDGKAWAKLTSDLREAVRKIVPDPLDAKAVDDAIGTILYTLLYFYMERKDGTA